MLTKHLRLLTIVLSSLNFKKHLSMLTRVLISFAKRCKGKCKYLVRMQMFYELKEILYFRLWMQYFCKRTHMFWEQTQSLLSECNTFLANANVLWANAKFLWGTQYFCKRMQMFCGWMQSLLGQQFFCKWTKSFFGGGDTILLQMNANDLSDCKVSWENANVLWVKVNVLCKCFTSKRKVHRGNASLFQENANVLRKNVHKNVSQGNTYVLRVTAKFLGGTIFLREKAKAFVILSRFFPSPCSLQGFVNQHPQLISCECEYIFFPCHQLYCSEVMNNY